MLKVIAYTGGRYSPSGIYRVRQYIAPLRERGIGITECTSWAGAHPPTSKWLRPFWALANLGERAPDAIKSMRYDLVFLQREMLSTFVTWEPCTKRPRILDVDDAIWVHSRGDFARRLAQACDHVICGNQFLAEQFGRWNKNITILPTPVNIHSFAPLPPNGNPSRLIIGWLGLSWNLRLLYGIEKALGEVLRRHPEAVLRVVTSEPPAFKTLPARQVEFVRWTPENEARSVQEMTIGIMPLTDDVYARGKCAYKMLLYMACGLPVVVSPVGMNEEVLGKGKVGFGARNDLEWIESLDTLLRSPDLRQGMGAAGRQVVLKSYSIEAITPELAKVLAMVAGK